jgi:hypothetical protein
MKINLLLILGIIASSLFNFTSSEAPESWIIMPPGTVMRIIENFNSHHQTIRDGGLSSSGSTYGIDVDALNELLMFILVIILIFRELIRKPVSKYFTFGFFAVFALSFLLMLTIGGWTLGTFGTWLFMVSVCGLLFWQHLESKNYFQSNHS